MWILNSDDRAWGRDRKMACPGVLLMRWAEGRAWGLQPVAAPPWEPGVETQSVSREEPRLANLPHSTFVFGLTLKFTFNKYFF